MPTASAVSVVRTGPIVTRYQTRALDPATWDLAFPAAWLYGVDAIAQMILVRLRVLRGEWVLNALLGVPYFDESIMLGSSSGSVRRFVEPLRKTILATPGVKRIDSIEPSFDGETRTLSVDFDATVDGGRVVVRADQVVP